MSKYGNFGVNQKRLIFLANFFFHVEELTNKFRQVFTQYMGVILRQFIV